MKFSDKAKRILFTAVIFAACVILSACNSILTPVRPNNNEETSTEKEYVITVNNGLIHVSSGKVKEGVSVTLTAEEVKNKIFLGWSYEGEMVTESKEYTFTAKEDAAINAIYCDAYTIYLDAGSGTVSATAKVVGKGQNYTLPTASLEHATFDGWSDGAVLFTDGTGKSNEAYYLDRDVVLYAHYTPTPIYSVTVNNGAEITSDTYYEGTEITVTAVSVTDNFFDGWFAMISGVETLLTDSVVYTFNATSDITVYAKYHLAYNVVVIGGSGGGYFEPNEECTVVANVPAGKSFVRWKNIDTDATVSTDPTYVFNVTTSVALEAICE